MIDKELLDRIAEYSIRYNSNRMHTDFQEEEISKFVEWLHQQCGIEYIKPKAKHQNTPEYKKE